MMKSLLEKDELNRLFTEYYEPMDVSEEQKKERVELAEDLFDAFLFAFLYIDTQLSAMVSVDVDVEEISEMVTRRYSDAVENYGIKLSEHPELETYIQNVSADIVDSTLENSDKKSDRKTAKPNIEDLESIKSGYSPKRIEIEQRAVNVAQNEANTVFNRYEYDNAVDNGFYLYKRWITENDEKVRGSHRDVNNQKIPIAQFFEVGDSLMLFPKDTSMGASLREIVNCRCSIEYTNDDSYSIKGSIKELNKRAGLLGMFEFLKNVNPDVINEYLDEYERIEEKFGDFQIKKISPLESTEPSDGYYRNGNIDLKNITGNNARERLKQRAVAMKKSGKWSTDSHLHTFRHECGHAIVEKYKLNADWELKEKPIRDIFNSIYKERTEENEKILAKEYANKVSVYAFDEGKIEELIAESVAEYLNGKCRVTARSVVNILLGE